MKKRASFGARSSGQIQTLSRRKQSAVRTYVHALVRTRANVRYNNDNFVIPVKAKIFRNTFSIGRRRELSTAVSIHGRRLFSRGGKNGSNTVVPSKMAFGEGILFVSLREGVEEGKGGERNKKFREKVVILGGKRGKTLFYFKSTVCFIPHLKPRLAVKTGKKSEIHKKPNFLLDSTRFF